METNRLSKVLASAGVASRRACEELIFEGRVKVNGEIVKVPQPQVTLGKEKILVDDKSITKTPKKHYYILNKPAGYICSNTTTANEKIVFDLFDQDLPPLFTVGRLDKDTSGLLIIACNKDAARIITKAFKEKNIEKQYEAILYGDLRYKSGWIVDGEYMQDFTFNANITYDTITKFEVVSQSEKFSFEENVM